MFFSAVAQLLVVRPQTYDTVRQNTNSLHLDFRCVHLLPFGFAHTILGGTIQFVLGDAVNASRQPFSIRFIVREFGRPGLVLDSVSSGEA